MFTRNEINSASVPGRTFHPWHELEEYLPDGGMWQIPSPASADSHVLAAADLMAIPPKFAAAMRRVLAEWPKSTATALSTPGLNKRAWLGHAGCYLEVGSPEETTRLAWHRLDDGEQFGANDAADTVIAEWRSKQVNSEPIMLGLWDA